ncbi:hypothetical protein AAVH_23889 [Aphelenchoides avenae]|nr:hypothetical protein AAVH_23889 [Aphelenchus avenae]
MKPCTQQARLVLQNGASILRIQCLTTLVFLSILPPQTHADCWNFLTGSRCDAEWFWSVFGYDRCEDECRNKGQSGGRCEVAPEDCGPFVRGVNVCRCN